MSRHARCPICDQGRLLTVALNDGSHEEVSACTNDTCPTNHPTVATTWAESAAEVTDAHRAIATQEIANIREEFTRRHRDGEWPR